MEVADVLWGCLPLVRRAGRAIRLTYDHKGSDAQEAKRIMDAGGFVMNSRVNGSSPVCSFSRIFPPLNSNYFDEQVYSPSLDPWAIPQ